MLSQKIGTTGKPLLINLKFINKVKLQGTKILIFQCSFMSQSETCLQPPKGVVDVIFVF